MVRLTDGRRAVMPRRLTNSQTAQLLLRFFLSVLLDAAVEASTDQIYDSIKNVPGVRTDKGWLA